MDTPINKEFYQGAMRCGTALGAVWSIMYLLLFAGATSMLSISLCLTLYIASPFIAARYAAGYRRKECDNAMSYLQAWIFLLYMYICATLLSALVIYIYFSYIDGGAFFMTLQKMLDESMKIAGTDELKVESSPEGREGEHVIEHAEAGTHRSLAFAVDDELKAHRGFAGGAGERSLAFHHAFSSAVSFSSAGFFSIVLNASSTFGSKSLYPTTKLLYIGFILVW